MLCICNQSYLPLRAEPADRAEMVSTILFGEVYELLEEVEGTHWHKARCREDGYQGYLFIKQPKEVKQNYLAAYDAENQQYLATSIGFAIINSLRIPLSAGTRIPAHNQAYSALGEDNYFIEGQTTSVVPFPETVLLLAQQFLGVPYLWGGRSSLGIDCSGLVQICYRAAGVALKRDASQQIAQGKVVPNLDAAQPGDAVFFSNKEGKVVHVGLWLQGNQLLHASEYVHIDSLNDDGIVQAVPPKKPVWISGIRRYL